MYYQRTTLIKQAFRVLHQDEHRSCYQIQCGRRAQYEVIKEKPGTNLKRREFLCAPCFIKKQKALASH